MLTVFRLHTKRCTAGRARLDRSFRKCSCPIHVEGKCGRDFIRKGLATTSWQRAQQRVMEAEARGSWDPLPEDQQAEPVTITEASAAFLKDAESGRRPGESTLRKYKLLLRQLTEFASTLGYRYIKEFDVESLRAFRDSWNVAPRTALKKLERMRAFFRFAQESSWIEKNVSKLVRGPAKIKDSQNLPFEPKEMETIIKACSEVNLYGDVTNDELLTFVYILRYSGLRIGDTSMLTIDRFKGNDLYLYTQKSGTHVYVPLPPFAMNLVREIKPRHGRYLFTGPDSIRMETAADLWRRKLHRAFKLAGVENAHPHRFRHTFAVELLKKGVPMEDVSILLGHSSVRTTERHYASWVQSRQELMRAHVAKTWESFSGIEGGKSQIG